MERYRIVTTLVRKSNLNPDLIPPIWVTKVHKSFEIQKKVFFGWKTINNVEAQRPEFRKFGEVENYLIKTFEGDGHWEHTGNGEYKFYPFTMGIQFMGKLVFKIVKTIERKFVVGLGATVVKEYKLQYKTFWGWRDYPQYPGMQNFSTYLYCEEALLKMPWWKIEVDLNVYTLTPEPKQDWDMGY